MPEKMGKIRQYLTDHFNTLPDNLNDFRNGHLLLLHIINYKSIGKTIDTVVENLPCRITQAQLRSLLNRAKKFKSIDGDAAMTKYSCLCCEPYTSFDPIQEDPQPVLDPEESQPGLSDCTCKLLLL